MSARSENLMVEASTAGITAGAGAMGIALMSFIETIAVGRAFRKAGEPQPDAGRELSALGLANALGGLFGAMPAGGGTSQSAVNRRAGARTQLSGLVTALGALATLLFLALVIGLAGCDSPQCKDGTLLLDVTFNSQAAGADRIAVQVALGARTLTGSFAPASTVGGTIEVSFPAGYPTGETASGMSISVTRTFLPGNSNLAIAQPAERPKRRLTATAERVTSAVRRSAARASGSEIAAE